jgi:hypothetical protein
MSWNLEIFDIAAFGITSEMASDSSDTGFSWFDEDLWRSQDLPINAVHSQGSPIESTSSLQVDEEEETEPTSSSPVETTAVSHEQEEGTEPTSSSPFDVELRGPIRRGRNITSKGKGPDSKTQSSDPWDSYNYWAESIAFRGLRSLGYEGIAIGPLRDVIDKVHEGAQKRGIAELLTHRNRMGRRRKPCAFHWLDENWCLVEEIFKIAVQEVLGNTSGVKRRGRPKLQP